MSQETSIVYKNIGIYRMVMNVLYTGSYKKRFQLIGDALAKEKPQHVLELCFGDIVVANYCKSKSIQWQGYDLNHNFVEYALKNGFEAKCQDLLTVDEFPKNDVTIISGSLYHFTNEQLTQLLKKIVHSTSKLIISEPIINLSDSKGLLGYVARRQANAGKGNESFRYNKETFTKKMEEVSKEFNLKLEVLGFIKKDMVIMLRKNGN
jgi:hypothetical protein